MGDTHPLNRQPASSARQSASRQRTVLGAPHDLHPLHGAYCLARNEERSYHVALGPSAKALGLVVGPRVLTG